MMPVVGVVVVLVEAVLGVEADALEVGVHDEVDDAGDGVRAVDRRGAAGQHVDAVDDRGRDDVDVGGRTCRDRPGPGGGR